MSTTSSRQTETLHGNAKGLDLQPDGAILEQLLASQLQALQATASAASELAAAAGLMVQSIRAGGRLHYAAAGSSALMGLADGAEIPGTFGLTADRIAIHMAGGVPHDGKMPGHTEDDTASAITAAAEVKPEDAVIAISASGSTPYPLAFAKVAQDNGASVICIANTANAPMFAYADVAIHLDTPPELIAGSTRLGAATAQKATLNMLSTLMGIRLGHVFDGMMVNVVADNDKLRSRAEGIVRQIADVTPTLAAECLLRAHGAVKPAVIMASDTLSLEQANQILDETNGDLRAALRHLRPRPLG
ncbi:N-acetylmuramic acid 6-phosphate etherase [Parasedimentitalea marina]|uniref:N-acetylmuramic acid 6-phosphate etherase n=1 Tax=Parasedimentitalea marina TaxID=2483033 RepID=A0A3T0MZ88_9RHOB|nr:N-acetylmuramic acid 6-phosphate etherase [Parasedimentitalea marina]AZV77086.1 N-acetylmuramic acid 6-phosphate etherase [Parasedimentitalea marina]